MFSKNSKLTQVNRTHQLMLMLMSSFCHLDNIYGFNRFKILLQDLVVNVISWDFNSLLRDSQFLHIKFFNPQREKFNLTIELPLLHPTSRKHIIPNVEIESDFNECKIFQSNISSTSSIK